jgi:YVTN family beta-propeller protein
VGDPMRELPVAEDQAVSRAARAWRLARARPRSLPLAMLLAGMLLAACASAPSATRPEKKATGGSDPTTATTASTATSTSTSTSTTTTTLPGKRVPAGPPADQRHLVLIRTIGGHISPKSVDASDTGFVFAQNMMYTHTVTVYDSAGDLVKTIPDTVDMALFGYRGHPGVTHGAPVEAAFTPDSRYVYVSNYSMYGVGMGPEGNDDCTPESAQAAGDTNSYVYRIDTKTLKIDQVIEVGLVPKFLAVTPNDKYLLVSNWCSYNLSVVDIATGKQVAELPMGPYPRGIAISPDSATAYVAIMGSDIIQKVDLDNLTLGGSFPVGSNPRHLVIDPTGRYLYVSLNAPGEVVKVDIATQRVVATRQTGDQCRSLAISTDGTALYVVNYLSDTVTMLRASDLGILQTVPTGVRPIGITYDAMTGDVWVAVYTGQILVFATR